jgi:Peptidase family M28
MPTVRPRMRRRPHDAVPPVHERLARITEGRLKDHVIRISGTRHHQSAPGPLEAAADYIRDQFGAAGLSVRTQRFNALNYRNRNIIGSMRLRRRGPGRSRPPLILAAHYDTVTDSPGADDNASGVAVMLEAARMLADLPLPVPIVFIGFAQEEQNRLGSSLYAREARRAGRRLHGIIVLECVGYVSLHPRSQQVPKGLPVAIPDVGDFLGVVGNLEAAGLKAGLERAARSYVPDLPLVGLLVTDAGSGFPDTRRSDHASFWDAGYPALMLTDTAEFRNPAYHRPGDIPEALDFAFMAKVTRAITGYLMELGMGEE